MAPPPLSPELTGGGVKTRWVPPPPKYHPSLRGRGEKARWVDAPPVFPDPLGVYIILDRKRYTSGDSPDLSTSLMSDRLMVRKTQDCPVHFPSPSPFVTIPS